MPLTILLWTLLGKIGSACIGHVSPSAFHFLTQMKTTFYCGRFFTADEKCVDCDNLKHEKSWAVRCINKKNNLFRKSYCSFVGVLWKQGCAGTSNTWKSWISIPYTDHPSSECWRRGTNYEETFWHFKKSNLSIISNQTYQYENVKLTPSNFH